MHLIVFSSFEKEEPSIELINRFDKEKVPFLLDAQGKSISWFKNNISNGRLFDINFTMFSIDDLDTSVVTLIIPLLLCVPTLGLTEFEWSELRYKLMSNAKDIFNAVNMTAEAESDYKRLPETESIGYHVEYKHDELHDCAFYQLTKPFTDLPYTVVVNNHSERGHIPFFASLFSVTSWGICGHDMDFLSKVWHEFGLPGEFNAEKVVLDAIELAKKDESKKPRVYRRTLDDVYQLFTESYWSK
jgi:hypothetical protein